MHGGNQRHHHSSKCTDESEHRPPNASTNGSKCTTRRSARLSRQRSASENERACHKECAEQESNARCLAEDKPLACRGRNHLRLRFIIRRPCAARGAREGARGHQRLGGVVLADAGAARLGGQRRIRGGYLVWGRLAGHSARGVRGHYRDDSGWLRETSPPSIAPGGVPAGFPCRRSATKPPAQSSTPGSVRYGSRRWP